MLIKSIKKNYGQIIAQLLVHIILFIFYSYWQDESEVFYEYKLSFFMNYAVASLIINYILLPKFYYKKKFWNFFIAVFFIITLVILVDEYVLEQIYFPTTRGTYFPGFIFTLSETLPLIIIFVGFKLAWDFNKKQSEFEKLQLLVKDSELQFLKSQINPHFLFNNLNNLYAYAIENSPKTPSIILELSSVLRYMLYDCKDDFVPLSKEINHLRNFTALNELQIEDRGEINFTTNSSTSIFLIAPLILNIFIENAFKHSTASQSENIKINIDININEQGLLIFKCTNSFLPIQNTQNISKGIGLINVKKRLELLYPNSSNLHIDKKENKYIVVLKMNLKPIN
ncbi:histidine kinase [Tenacibaculum finnmarkense]|uniref:sensor histidine kinase n=1 Tax=Tenacibaculum finnmarkense TaxID=2781243 RepID=UPI001EFAAECF|nr:histidine kinase [Tenacibaculum finnmarkense]MCG8882348.1 histidine kinase [Tenacibaculum finnmarkense]